MGLDLSHLQLTHTPNNNGDFFTIDDWDLDCNVSLKTYAKYITTIPELDFNKSIAIVKNDEDLEKLKKDKWFSAINYLKVFVGEVNDKMNEQLAKFISSQKLHSLETSQLAYEHDGVKYHTISFAEETTVQGVYYIDYIGYQRKGMKNLFYDKFEKHFLWGNKEDFELAYTCIGGKWYIEDWEQEAVDEMKKNFKEHFIDKFEFGKSLLCVG